MSKPGGAIKRTLETLAEGMGKPYAVVLGHYLTLSEDGKFAFIRGARQLEDEYQRYAKDPAAYLEAQKPVLYGPDGEEVP